MVILHNSRSYHHFTGKERLDVHLLQPSRLEVVQEQLQDDMCYAYIADLTLGSSASILLRIPSFAGFHQSLLCGLEITMVRSLVYLPCVARNRRQVN